MPGTVAVPNGGLNDARALRCFCRRGLDAGCASDCSLLPSSSGCSWLETTSSARCSSSVQLWSRLDEEPAGMREPPHSQFRCLTRATTRVTNQVTNLRLARLGGEARRPCGQRPAPVRGHRLPATAPRKSSCAFPARSQRDWMGMRGSECCGELNELTFDGQHARCTSKSSSS